MTEIQKQNIELVKKYMEQNRFGTNGRKPIKISINYQHRRFKDNTGFVIINEPELVRKIEKLIFDVVSGNQNED